MVEIFTIFATGALSDRVGRRAVTAAGLLGAAVWAFALFPLAAASVPALMLAAAVGGLCHGTIVGGMSAFFVELFPTSARYTGFSVGYQLATIFSGAVAPLIGIALLTVYGSAVPVSLYAAAMTGPALVCIGISRETRGEDAARAKRTVTFRANLLFQLVQVRALESGIGIVEAFSGGERANRTVTFSMAGEQDLGTIGKRIGGPRNPVPRIRGPSVPPAKWRE